MNALRRFLSRRGLVVHIYSDNVANLVGAERILCESIQQWNQHKFIIFSYKIKFSEHLTPHSQPYRWSVEKNNQIRTTNPDFVDC